MARLNRMQTLAVVVAMVLSWQRVEAATQTWSLDYPRGGEVFIAGSTQKVVVSGKVPAAPVVDLCTLVSGTQTLTLVANLGTMTVVKNIAADFSFTVPQNTASNFVIRITVTPKNKPAAPIVSAPFSIVQTLSSVAPGVLSGDVTGTLDATVVGQVGGVSAANVAGGANLANAATSISIANTLVKRDANGAFSARGVSASGSGVAGTTTSAVKNAAGITGNFNAATAATGSAGVIGNCNTTDGTGTAVAGVHNSDGTGVYGYSDAGTGVNGEVDVAGGNGVFGINTDVTDRMARSAGQRFRRRTRRLRLFRIWHGGRRRGGQRRRHGRFRHQRGQQRRHGRGNPVRPHEASGIRPGSNNCAVFQNYDTNAGAATQVARIDGQGNIFCAGTLTTKSPNADLAEAFAVEGKKSGYEPGDVLMISTRSDCTVTKSDASYSTRIMGVYASHPGVLLGAEADDRVPLGVVGVIPTKVCGENGAIHRGDMLVSASTPGRAMKGDPAKLGVGMVLGKALEDFTGGGTGKINVLVNVK